MYATKTTGTANHCKKIAAIMAMPTKINFGKLFFIVKSLNFNAIKGSLLTINELSKIIIPYKNHLLSKIEFTNGVCIVQ